MSVQIPNTSTSGTVGSPSPANVATESADNSQVPVASDHIQQVALVNLAVEMRNALNLLAQALSLAPDPGSGRLRVFLDPGGGAQTLGTVTAVTTVTTVSALTKFGTGPDASTIVFDAMLDTWANSVLPTIARS